MEAQARYARSQKTCGLKPGQYARLSCRPHCNDHWPGDWDEELDEMIGTVFRVAALEMQGVLLADANTGKELFHVPWDTLDVVDNPAAKFFPGEKVLVRDRAGDDWEEDVFRWYEWNDDGYPWHCVGEAWKECRKAE